MASEDQPDRKSFAALLAEKSQPLDNQRDKILKQTAAKLVQDRFLPQVAAKSGEAEIEQGAVAQFDNNPFWIVPWGHHVVMMQTDGVDTPFGHRWDGEIANPTPAHLAACLLSF